jgi:hypothetical protein
MMRVSASVLAASIVACASPKPSADSLTAVDTMKPAVVAAADTIGAPVTGSTTKAQASAGTRTKAPGPPTAKVASPGLKTARDTGHLGRDSVIKINPRDPARTIPTKKP